MGEPGVGKSRLVRSCWRGSRRSSACSRPAPYRIRVTAAYLPVVGLLRDYFRLTDADDARGIREKVTAALLDLDAPLLALLAPLLALFDVARRRRRLVGAGSAAAPPPHLDAIRQLLLRESRRQPLCLVVEDLHWIDAETQAVLDALVENIPTAAILPVVTYRPEYAHEWSRKSYYAQLSVPPLPPATRAADLMSALLGPDPGLVPLAARLIERTEGNPLFPRGKRAAPGGDRRPRGEARRLSPDGAGVRHRGARHRAGAGGRAHRPAELRGQAAAPVRRRHRQRTSPAISSPPIIRAERDELRHGLRRLQSGEFLYERGLFPSPSTPSRTR